MRKCRRDSRKPRGVGPRQITSGPHYGVVAKSGLKCWFLIWSTMRPPPPASTGLAECLVLALLRLIVNCETSGKDEVRLDAPEATDRPGAASHRVNPQAWRIAVWTGEGGDAGSNSARGRRGGWAIKRGSVPRCACAA